MIFNEFVFVPFIDILLIWINKIIFFVKKIQKLNEDKNINNNGLIYLFIYFYF